MFNLHFLPEQTVDRRRHLLRCAAGRDTDPAAPLPVQAGTGKQALQLAGHGFTRIEQARPGGHAGGDGRCHPGVMRAAENHDIGLRGAQRGHISIQQCGHRRTLGASFLDGIRQTGARLGNHLNPLPVGIDQAAETLALQGARGRQHTDDAALGQGNGRLHARLKGDNRQIDGRPDRLGSGGRRRIAGHHQRLAAALGQAFGNAHATLAQEGLRLLAIRQETGIGKIEKVLVRQARPQGLQDRQPTQAGIEDSNRIGVQACVSAKKKPPRGGFIQPQKRLTYMRSIIASPNSEQEISFAPAIRRAKS